MTIRLKLCLLLLLLPQLFLTAQVQWYQNQDGNNSFPNGTYAGSVRSLNSTSFIATYLWHADNDQYTWKVSKTNTNGTELKTFFVTGTTATMEARVGGNQSVYILKGDYPLGQSPVFTVYKLNANLQVVKEYAVSVPADFVINTVNVFELDDNAGVYLAGDGAYMEERAIVPGSFVLKLDKNLVKKWDWVQTGETAFSRMHIDSRGKIVVLEDHYSHFPMVNIFRLNSNGTLASSAATAVDGSRYSLSSILDRDDNLILFGGKMVGDTAQAVYLTRVSPRTGSIFYSKTLFTALVSQLNDIKMDNNGKLFSLVSAYAGPGSQFTYISRINISSGQLHWNKAMSFDTDSCLFSKLVMGSGDRFFAVGERRSNIYFAKGFALRMKKNGQADSNIPAPDSASHQRYHSLTDGIMDNNNRLISIGNTNDFDTLTYSSTYYRAFAVRLAENECEERNTAAAGEIPVAENEKPEAGRLQVYPNPVQSTLIVSNMNPEEFDKLAVYNMQGAVVLQQKVNSSTVRLDISNLTDGVYLLIFRSSSSLKEKTVKFVVRK